MVKIGQAAGRPLIWEAGQFLMSFSYFVVLGKRHLIVELTLHRCYHLEDTAARKQGKVTIEKFNQFTNPLLPRKILPSFEHEA